jgi:hypothetical protein
MEAEAEKVNLARDVRRFDVPVFFILGRLDNQVVASVSAEYFAAVEAPHKELFWLEHVPQRVRGKGTKKQRLAAMFLFSRLCIASEEVEDLGTANPFHGFVQPVGKGLTVPIRFQLAFTKFSLRSFA